MIEALRAQIEFAGRNVGFWSSRLRDARVAADGIRTVEDFERLPPLRKEDLRRLEPWDLVPRSSRDRLYLCRSTSGTTGSATSVFWTRADWQAMIETTAEELSERRPDIDVVALNGYHLGHGAGRWYEDVIRLLGGVSIPRHYLADDEAATLEQLRRFGCNTMVLTQRSGLKKSGRSVEDLLRHDPEFFHRHGIRWWMGSSSTFTDDVRETALRQGVLEVTNLYGSSEFGVLAVSCPAEPASFHLVLGHVFIEVVRADGRAVESGERGRIVVTHLLAAHPDGGVSPHEATQLLRLDNGDEATFFDDRCACGRRAPRIRDVRRQGASAPSA